MGGEGMPHTVYFIWLGAIKKLDLDLNKIYSTKASQNKKLSMIIYIFKKNMEKLKLYNN